MMRPWIIQNSVNGCKEFLRVHLTRAHDSPGLHHPQGGRSLLPQCASPNDDGHPDRFAPKQLTDCLFVPTAESILSRDREFKCPIEGTEPLVELKFQGVKAISYPGGDRYKLYDECEQNEFAEGCSCDNLFALTMTCMVHHRRVDRISLFLDSNALQQSSKNSDAMRWQVRKFARYTHIIESVQQTPADCPSSKP
eukprot:6186326-Pleurochrysis_carterae.AAC.6